MAPLIALQQVDETLARALEQILTLGGHTSAAETWLIISVVLLILEIFTFGFFLGAVAISTLITALVAWGGASVHVQLAIFALMALASMLWLRPVFVRLLSPAETPTNTDALIGKLGTVIDPVSEAGVGRVKVGNEEWRATGEQSLGVGEQVRVVRVTGNTLTVSRARPEA